MIPLPRLALALVPLAAAPSPAQTPAQTPAQPPAQSRAAGVPAPTGLLWPDAAMTDAACRGSRSAFGAAVALSAQGAGATWALVGAPQAPIAGEPRGAARLHRRTAGRTPRWVPAARAALDGPTLDAGAALGSAVAVAQEAAVAGAPGHRGGEGAVVAARLDARGVRGRPRLIEPGAPGPGARTRAFGAALALGESADGQLRWLAVGAPESTVVTGAGPVELAGSVHVLSRSVRAAGGWEHSHVVVAPAPLFAARFGASVAFAGETLLVGAPGDGAAGPAAGRVFAFGPAGTPLFDLGPPAVPAASSGARYGRSLAAGPGGLVAVGAPGAGLVELFQAGPAGPVHRGLLTGSALDGFGTAVAVARGCVVVGEPRAWPDGAGRAAVFLLERRDWRRAGSLVAPHPTARGEFGAAIAADGDHVVVGEPAAGAACPPRRPRCAAGGATVFMASAGTGHPAARGGR